MFLHREFKLPTFLTKLELGVLVAKKAIELGCDTLMECLGVDGVKKHFFRFDLDKKDDVTIFIDYCTKLNSTITTHISGMGSYIFVDVFIPSAE